MDLKKAKALLADYYEGKTSREEETLLTGFFMGPEVPPELEPDRHLFFSLSESAKETFPDSYFDDRFLAAIDNADKKKRTGKLKSLFVALSGLAAALLLVTGIYFLLRENQPAPGYLVNEEKFISDPETAYLEAKNALFLISQVMNKGTEELSSLSRITYVARELQAISRFEDTVAGVTGKNE
jgi:hypothetical protein